MIDFDLFGLNSASGAAVYVGDPVVQPEVCEMGVIVVREDLHMGLMDEIVREYGGISLAADRPDDARVVKLLLEEGGHDGGPVAREDF